MKIWKDVKIPDSLFQQIKVVIANNENYNSVSDFTRIAAMKELERLRGDKK
ncbi:MAG: hypothetical protein RE471_04820 [Ferroplasma sp.]|jgi:hypothetical protein|uniref:hypothetical protein n=1 Tax=Ferroplasma sp. TaxID=2591003 RepID=UPI0028161B94|nr:hypothetical protein [Ferroplasma sp.]WMT52204.1 MAG: hypothetical protein RE471_04820 [Ferroplasma sp.]